MCNWNGDSTLSCAMKIYVAKARTTLVAQHRHSDFTSPCMEPFLNGCRVFRYVILRLPMLGISMTTLGNKECHVGAKIAVHVQSARSVSVIRRQLHGRVPSEVEVVVQNNLN